MIYYDVFGNPWKGLKIDWKAWKIESSGIPPGGKHLKLATSPSHT